MGAETLVATVDMQEWSTLVVIGEIAQWKAIAPESPDPLGELDGSFAVRTLCVVLLV
jgi:hypothetical protein